VIVGAVDIGTNSVRLYVTDGERDLERTSTITRLGEGVDAAGRLSGEAVERTLEELRRLREKLDTHGVERVRVVATSAARDADNRDEFFAAVEDALGHRPVLLTGEEEGRFAFAGATAGMGVDGLCLVIDIGGGSTELVLGDRDGVHAVKSLDVGAVRLTESIFERDPPRPEELTNAIGIAADLLEDTRVEVPEIGEARTLIGVAGTITTVAAVELGGYDPARIHGFFLSREAAEDVFRTLATEPLADRIHNPGLPRDRADVIVGGCCIVVALLRGLRADGLIVSEHDLLDGIAAALLRGDEAG
jgi:exopolyphosphatase / guanosine-5'-triphosphate,3'-diphosphate pyrophosphatase